MFANVYRVSGNAHPYAVATSYNEDLLTSLDGWCNSFLPERKQSIHRVFKGLSRGDILRIHHCWPLLCADKWVILMARFGCRSVACVSARFDALERGWSSLEQQMYKSYAYAESKSECLPAENMC